MQILPQKSQELFTKRKSDYKQLGNKGLLFERFYDGYDSNFEVDQQADTRELYELSGVTGENKQISDTASRRISLVNSLNGVFGVFSTDWHFVTGMGHAHPAENGFSWHPVLGTPYLPGTGVKGLLRAWMEQYASIDEQEEREELVRDWFGGSASASGPDGLGKAGDLIFFDAIPVECPTVGLDIMTPHMGDWYEKGDEKPQADNMPGDWHNPIPVSFLVTKEARFLFAVAPRKPEVLEFAKQAMEHLKEALAWLGAGGKTAAGYGHMTFDENDSLKRLEKAEDIAQEQQEQQALAAMSPEEQAVSAIEKRVKSGEGQGQGSGGELAADLAQLCEQASSWTAVQQQLLRKVALVACKHLGIDVKKNKRWRERLRNLRAEG